MADNTLIEWCDATVNAVNGCSVLSPGCANSYAMRSGSRGLPNHPSTGLTQPSKAGHVWTGEVRLNEEQLLRPLRWRRPRRIFWNAHGDLFHDAVPDEWIDRVFAVCALTPQHTHMILTKRVARMRKYVSNHATPHRIARAVLDMAIADPKLFRRKHWPVISIGDVDAPTDVTISWSLPNVWLGASVEDRQRADERLPDLRETPVAVRFVSFEPLLGAVHADLTGIQWAIVGGESGPGARPMHPDWARSLRDQCAAAGVAFFFKQWGEFAPGEIAGDYLDPDKPAKGLSHFDGRWDECWSEVEGHCDDEPDVYRIGKKRAGRLLDGREHSEFPA